MIDRSKLIGISALIGAGFLFGLSAVLAKYLTGVMNPFAAIEFRFLIAFIVVAVIILLRRKLVFKNLDSKLLVIYASSFPASVIFITLAIYHGTATVTTVAAFGTILICSFLLGRIFLNEK